MFYYPSETLNYLYGKQTIQEFIDPIPKLCLEIFENDQYNKKVVSMGLISILFNQPSTLIDSTYIIMTFKNLIELLQYELKLPTQQFSILKKGTHAKIKQSYKTSNSAGYIELKDFMSNDPPENIDIIKVSQDLINEKEVYNYKKM